MYPTLIELCNLPVNKKLDGVSLVSSLKNPSTAIERNVFIPHAERESYVVVNMNWRYINYKDDSEELYNVKEDPEEWYNLAGDRKYHQIMQDMRKSAPSVFSPEATPKKNLNLIIEGDSFHWEKRNK